MLLILLLGIHCIINSYLSLNFLHRQFFCSSNEYILFFSEYEFNAISNTNALTKEDQIQTKRFKWYL